MAPSAQGIEQLHHPASGVRCVHTPGAQAHASASAMAAIGQRRGRRRATRLGQQPGASRATAQRADQQRRDACRQPDGASSARAAHLPAGPVASAPFTPVAPWRRRCWQAAQAARPPAGPARTNEGATNESFRFSARLSMAASRTWCGASAATSRLTSRASRARPAWSDSTGACSTASTSSCSMAQASSGFNSPNASAASRPAASRDAETAR